MRSIGKQRNSCVLFSARTFGARPLHQSLCYATELTQGDFAFHSIRTKMSSPYNCMQPGERPECQLAHGAVEDCVTTFETLEPKITNRSPKQPTTP